MNQPNLQVIHGEVYASSLEIAERFKVEHHNVLRAIERRLGQLKSELANGLTDGSRTAEFASAEFIEKTYKDAGNHSRKMYLLTEEGFAMSAFLFKTKEALIWQVNYIMAFKSARAIIMEKAIDKIRFQSAEQGILGGDMIRKSFPVAYVAQYLRHRGILPDITTTKINDLINDGKIDGKFIPRKSIVYADSVRTYLGSLGILNDSIANELGGREYADA